MKKKYTQIALFVDALDLFFLPKKYQKSSYAIVAKDTPLYTFAKSQFANNKLIPITMHSPSGKLLSDKKILYHENFLTQLREKSISHIVMPYQCTKMMDHWAKKHHITLIGTPYPQQRFYENKNNFDKFLKKYSIPSPKTLSLTKTTTYKHGFVVQSGISRGLEGTNFFSSWDEAVRYVKNKKTHNLIREYKKGTPIGVSITISPRGDYFFSALRRQCFLSDKGYPKVFLGIQWIPTDFFTKKTLEKIQFTLTTITQALIQKKFIGIANIDMIITDSGAYVLECNPRLSAASAQAFSNPKLNGYQNSYEFFLDIFLGANNKTIKNDSIPQVDYQGCLLDIELKNKFFVKDLLPVGIYELIGNTVQYVGTDIDTLNYKNRILMTHELQKKGLFSANTLCTIISNTSLYSLTTGALNKKGEIIYDFFKNSFLRT